MPQDFLDSVVFLLVVFNVPLETLFFGTNRRVDRGENFFEERNRKMHEFGEGIEYLLLTFPKEVVWADQVVGVFTQEYKTLLSLASDATMFCSSCSFLRFDLLKKASLFFSVLILLGIFHVWFGLLSYFKVCVY